MVHITYSYTTATILESSGIYKYAHNEVKVLSAVVKSIRDPTISRDVTPVMKHFISTQKMSDSVSMKSFTVDSSKLIDYTGGDIDPGHQKKMEIKLAYSDCVYVSTIAKNLLPEFLKLSKYLLQLFWLCF